MNKKLLIFIIVVMAFVFGCSKNAQNGDLTNSNTENEEIYTEMSGTQLGVFLIDGHYCFENDEGKMQFKAYLNAGDTVNWTGEKKEAVRHYDGVVRTYYRVELNGDFWVHDYYITGPAQPAVITSDETVLYTRPDPSAVARTGTVTLPKYTLVAMMEDDDLTDEYIPITVLVPSGRLEGRYVKIKDISWDQNDVGGVKLARVASTTQNSAARKELLKNAMEMIGNGSNFYNVPMNINHDPVLFELEVTDNLEILTVNQYGIVYGSKAIFRDIPSINGNITRRLVEGDFEIFTITAKSKKTETLEIDDEKISGIWLKTLEDDWVFNYNVEPYEPVG